MKSKYFNILTGLLCLVTSLTSQAQPADLVLSSPESGTKLHQATNSITFNPGYSYTPNGGTLTADVVDQPIYGDIVYSPAINPATYTMNIKDFDVDKFYSVVISTIEEFAKNEYVPKERIFIYQPEGNTNEISKNDKMSERVFWELIEQAKEENKNFTDRIEALVIKLSKLSEKQIIGFEYTFREMLAKSAHYNILAAAKIISGQVSDDSFLYFRCRLMAEGNYLYFKAIETPDYIAEANVREIEFGGEEMLSVADQAFILKNGEDTDKELPRDVAYNYYNYDEGEEIIGKEWKDEDLPKRYPLLWNKYRRKNEELQ